MCNIFTISPPPFFKGQKSGKFGRIVALCLLSVSAISYAQEGVGRVGINTESPRATMEIIPSKVNGKDNATTNEGLIIPQLSKTRVANIDNAKLVKGTLVYVKETTPYTGKNPKVLNIDKAGFYHYDGSQWVKGTGEGTMVADNIYTTDGTLSSTRSINTNRNNLLLKGGGNLGININTNAPQAMLDVHGTVRIGNLPENDDPGRIVVADDNGVLNSIETSAFKTVLSSGLEVEDIYGINGKETELNCNASNLGQSYLLPEGILTCSSDDENHGGLKTGLGYYWDYVGTVHFTNDACKQWNHGIHAAHKWFALKANTIPLKKHFYYTVEDDKGTGNRSVYPFSKVYRVDNMICKSDARDNVGFMTSMDINISTIIKLKR